MAASDLTTLANVKAWLGITTTSSDGILTPLVTSVSRSIYSALSRSNILPASYSEVLDGQDSNFIVLNHWPVVSISSLTIGTEVVSQAASFTARGWALETVDPTPPSRASSIYYRHGRFWRGQQNVAVSYRAGYQVSSETQTIGSATLTAQAPYGAWASDQGVVYASSSQTLTAVASAPAQGQYSVSAGVYTFNAADDNQAVSLSYGYIPADLAQACMEWVAQRFKAKDSIGFRTKSLGGQETIGVDTSAAPAVVMALIQPYRRVTIC